jgi:glycosyltransferase involved in cell wall biosynthesis
VLRRNEQWFERGCVMAKPVVSVIIPCSRPVQVKHTLECLARQTYPANMQEIILVGTSCAGLDNLYPIKVSATKTLCSPGEARNIGARAALGAYLLFLDDDCEPAPNWITENLRALEAPGVGAVGGCIAGKSPRFFARCVDFSRFGFAQTQEARETWVCSASLGVKRQAFETVQGFNEQLRAEEDIDFCFRLWTYGYKTLYQPAVQVLHDHGRATLPALVSYSYYAGRASGLAVKRLYPQFSRRNKLLTSIQHPWLYPLLILPVATGAALNLIRINIKTYPQVTLYAPFILLSKIASHLGIWRWLVHESKKSG